MARRPARFVLTGFVIAAISVGLLVAAEFGLRLIFKPSETDYAAKLAKSPYAFDPNYLIRIKGNVEKSFRRSPENGGDKIVWRSNDQGYRGPALRNESDLRVVVYGDSNIQAEFSHLKDTYAFQLQENLKRRTGRTVEVINAGVIGFGPDQSVLRMAAELATLKPDVVILNVFADNDFGDIVRNRLFEMNEKGALVRSKHALTPDEAFRDERHRCEQTIADRIFLAKAAKKVAQFVGLGTGQDARSGLSKVDYRIQLYWNNVRGQWKAYAARAPRCFSAFGDTYDIDLATSPESESAKEKVALMRRVLANAAEIAEEHATSFFVQVQPSTIDLTMNFRIGYGHLTRFDGYERRNLSGAVMQACRDEMLNCIDLFPVFKDRDPTSLFFKGKDNHWNDAGQALAADVAADVLIDQLQWARTVRSAK